MQILEQKQDVRAALKRLVATSNKPGLDGCLPETMPAGVLLTPYLRSLQQALLPFQVCVPLLSLLESVLQEQTAPYTSLSRMFATGGVTSPVPLNQDQLVYGILYHPYPELNWSAQNCSDAS